VSTTDVVAPATTDELVAALALATPRTRLLAGGTDLVNDIRRPGRQPDRLIDLSHVPGLSYVRLDGVTLRVGATTTFTELQSDPLVHEHAFCLGRAASQVGSAQIRNVATVGGNIANASPCADGATALVALSADVTTLDGSGRRATRPLRDILVGSGRTALAHDEAIVEFSFPALGAEHRSAFAKIGWRTAVSVARLSMAIVVRLDAAAEALGDVRIGLGAVGETAFRDALLEGLLEGRPADEESARLLAEGCTDAVRRSIPGRYSLPYKERAAMGLAYDAWNALRICPPCEPAWG
jgi:xanthine dehydrogenase FAD-binding subunit